MILDDFFIWLNENTVLSPSSLKHYKGGVRTISHEMLEKKVIRIPLEEMSAEQLEVAIFNIFHDSSFIEKNKTGTRMYSNSLKHFLAFIKDTKANITNSLSEVEEINNNKVLNVTEKESLIKSRIGQGVFRNKLIQKYNGKCIITGITDKRLLIASHIKPWSVSDNLNRLSEENGLLLSSLYDKMFGLGLITFTENGEILVSKELHPSNIAIIGIKTDFKYPLMYTHLLQENMEYHRDVVFLKG